MKIATRHSREVSAGGLVTSASEPEKVAIISHLNRGGRADWCIPKGHPERGESIEQAAVREVFEETGIEAEIVSKIGEINYSFKVGQKRIHKTVHHFLMRQLGGELTHELDPTGEVVAVTWFELSKLDEVLAHENERRVAAQARELLE
jgi:YD repeat-containing protein